MTPMPTMTRTNKLLTFLIVAGAAMGSGVTLAQAPLTLATPAEVPAVVAIARPSAERGGYRAQQLGEVRKEG